MCTLNCFFHLRTVIRDILVTQKFFVFAVSIFHFHTTGHDFPRDTSHNFSAEGEGGGFR